MNASNGNLSVVDYQLMLSIIRYNIKHEYLISRAYICLSLSSTSSSPVVIQIWPLSRYSCFYLGSLHPRNFFTSKSISFHCTWFVFVLSKWIETSKLFNLVWEIPNLLSACNIRNFWNITFQMQNRMNQNQFIKWIL